jgi:chemotaxis protein CheZ
MPVQRKVFRIEQMSGAPTAIAPAAADAPHHHEILAELKALQELIEHQTQAAQAVQAQALKAQESRKSDTATLEASGLRQLKDETDTIHRAIVHTKHEIATLHAGTFRDGKPRATRELDAVVDGTERATQQILDAAEVIEEAANSLSASVKQGQEKALAQDIQDHVLRIFEACNFQDLSGQRIAKVLATLQFVEDHIARMMEIWGGAEAFKDYTAAATHGGEPNPLLHGPKLDDDSGHASQADIDAMFKTR